MINLTSALSPRMIHEGCSEKAQFFEFYSAVPAQELISGTATDFIRKTFFGVIGIPSDLVVTFRQISGNTIYFQGKFNASAIYERHRCASCKTFRSDPDATPLCDDCKERARAIAAGRDPEATCNNCGQSWAGETQPCATCVAESARAAELLAWMAERARRDAEADQAAAAALEVPVA